MGLQLAFLSSLLLVLPIRELLLLLVLLPMGSAAVTVLVLLLAMAVWVRRSLPFLRLTSDNLSSGLASLSLFVRALIVVP